MILTIQTDRRMWANSVDLDQLLEQCGFIGSTLTLTTIPFIFSWVSKLFGFSWQDGELNFWTLKLEITVKIYTLLGFPYRKNPKISDTQQFIVITLKVEQNGVSLE